MGFKNPVSAKGDEKPKVPNESKENARKDNEKKRNDGRDAGQPKLKESESHAGHEVLVTAAIDSKRSVPMSKIVRAEYILVGDGLANKAFLKYLLSLMDTGTQKNNMRSIPVHLMLNDHSDEGKSRCDREDPSSGHRYAHRVRFQVRERPGAVVQIGQLLHDSCPLGSEAV